MANSGTMRHGDASLGAGKSLHGSLGNPHLVTSSPQRKQESVLTFLSEKCSEGSSQN